VGGSSCTRRCRPSRGRAGLIHPPACSPRGSHGAESGRPAQARLQTPPDHRCVRCPARDHTGRRAWQRRHPADPAHRRPTDPWSGRQVPIPPSPSLRRSRLRPRQVPAPHPRPRRIIPIIWSNRFRRLNIRTERRARRRVRSTGQRIVPRPEPCSTPRRAFVCAYHDNSQGGHYASTAIGGVNASPERARTPTPRAPPV
jgi:hypothetical protein